jgi:hypothetical protein
MWSLVKGRQGSEEACTRTRRCKPHFDLRISALSAEKRSAGFDMCRTTPMRDNMGVKPAHAKLLMQGRSGGVDIGFV